MPDRPDADRSAGGGAPTRHAWEGYQRAHIAEAGPGAGARILPWPGAGASAYGRAVERAFTGLSDRLGRLLSEHADAQSLYRDLTQAHPSRRRLMVRNCHRYHRLAVCDLLLEKSLRTLLDDPAQARDMAELAIEVATSLRREGRWGGLPADLQARAWAYLGNAHRALGEPRRAHGAFATAERCLAEGTGDPLEAAQVLQLRALLAADEGDFAAAEHLLDREITLYRQSHHEHLVGRALVHKAHVRARQGDLETAIVLCRRGLESLDPRSERHLALIARRNLVHYLDAAGRYLEAQKVLATTRKLDVGCSDGWTDFEGRWLEGKVARRAGHLEAAGDAFEKARRGFLGRGDVYEAARATLELAVVYSRQGRQPDLSRLAREMAPLLCSPELRPAAVQALGELQRAAATQQVTTELVERVGSRLALEQEAPELYQTLTS